MKTLLHPVFRFVSGPSTSHGRLRDLPSVTLRFRSIHSVIITLLLAVLATASVQASDPIGIYALAEKVVLEPNDANPERIQIWGVFALAKGRGYDYDSARRGYLYYKLNPEKKEACLKEWADLKATAGTKQCLAFGSRHQEKGAIREKVEKPKNPDVYPVAFGLTKVPDKDYKPIKEILALAESKSGGRN